MGPFVLPLLVFLSLGQCFGSPPARDEHIHDDPRSEDSTLFFVGRSGPWSSINNQVIFDEVRVNSGGRFIDNIRFVPDHSGIHFFSLSAGASGHTPFDVQMKSDEHFELPGAIYRSSTQHNGSDVMFRDVIAQCEAGVDISVHTETNLESDLTQLATSWTGFNLEDVMQNLTTFSAVRNSVFNSTGQAANLPMDDVIINEGSAFTTDGSYFTAPEDGIYYFSFSVGQVPFVESRVSLLIDSVLYPQAEVDLWKGSNNHNGLDMQSRAVLARLTKGQRAWLAVQADGVVYSEEEHFQTAFAGYHYNPSHGIPGAWCVHRLTSHPAGEALDPIPFEEITVNEGDLFNDGFIDVSTSGYYFIEFNIGVLGGQAVNVELVRTGFNQVDEVLAGVARTSFAHENYDNVGRSLIARLESGDRLRLRVAQGTGFFSTRERHTSFLGLLLAGEPDVNPTTPTTEGTTEESEITEWTTQLATTELPTTETTTSTVTTDLPTPTTTEGHPGGPNIDNATAFYATRHSPWNNVGWTYVTFDDVPVNIGHALIDKTTLIVDRPGLYFFSFSTSVDQYGVMDTVLETSSAFSHEPHIFRGSTSHNNQDMIHRNSLAVFDMMDMTTYDSYSSMYSDEGNLISWMGINLLDAFNDTAAFYVTRNSSFHIHGAIMFEEKLIDTKDAFNMEFGYFTAPKTGLYFLTYGVGQAAGIESRVDLRTRDVGGDPQTEVSLTKQSSEHNELDMQTRSTLVHLDEGEDIWVALTTGEIHSDTRNQISFAGFHLDPLRAPLVAWCAHRFSSWHGIASPLDPVPFPLIEVNEGDIYNPDTHVITVSISGYYYIEVNIGALPDRAVGVDILRADMHGTEDLLGRVSRKSTVHRGIDSIGRSVFVYLAVGDTLRLRAHVQTGIFSHDDKATTFMGFLVYEA
ncbi:hypothetical protein CAPTEDRAFT_215797 [Capitella teleta]|uniref:C1q domain-containing protein n=1 Tax=Capitella teleta TaxID=283909 RepID=R7UJV9_CAPTE|nr:hypothetical protein CAPTEDRAFT_215797 [Capitella teleta]|eukprot:ELU06839.1 hypothetical protein CAPTEDRAFT_215797 [Capitella teleta]